MAKADKGDLTGVLAVIAAAALAAAGVALGFRGVQVKALNKPQPIAENIEGVVLFIADTFRGDVVGMEIEGVEVTPYINRLAREGTYFSEAYATANLTKTGVASIISGEPPQVHGIMWRAHAIPRMPTFAGIMKQAGYNTYGLVNNGWIRPEEYQEDVGFSRGFDSYRYFAPRQTVTYGIRPGNMPLSQHRYETDEVLRKHLLGMLDGTSGDGPRIESPFYLQYHSMTTHWPYPPEKPGRFTGRFLSLILGEQKSPEEAWEIYWKLVADLKYSRKMDRPGDKDFDAITEPETKIMQAMYFEAAAELDETVRILHEELQKRSNGRIRFVFTGDHGESLGGEDREFDHGKLLGESVTRVPLIFWGPGFKPRTVKSRVSNYCTAHTVFDVLDIESPANSMGFSLLGVGEENMPVYACMNDAATYIAANGHRVERLPGKESYLYYDVNGNRFEEAVFSDEEQVRLRGEMERFEATADALRKARRIDKVYTMDEYALRLDGLSEEEISAICGGERQAPGEVEEDLRVMRDLGYLN